MLNNKLYCIITTYQVSYYKHISNDSIIEQTYFMAMIHSVESFHISHKIHESALKRTSISDTYHMCLDKYACGLTLIKAPCNLVIVGQKTM